MRLLWGWELYEEGLTVSMLLARAAYEATSVREEEGPEIREAPLISKNRFCRYLVDTA